MQDIFDKTWVKSYSSTEEDTDEQFLLRLKVTKVVELKYDKLLEKYLARLKKFQQRARGMPGGRFKKVDGRTTSVMTEWIHGINSLTFPCKEEVNELVLFHGTPKGNIDKKGLSLDKAMRGPYGRALFFAESAQKADQYASKTFGVLPLPCPRFDRAGVVILFVLSKL